MDSHEHDGRLIRASIDDPDRFAAIFERHYGAIDRYCVRRIGPDGHDVSATTFVDAFRLRHRFDDERADARPWLYGIAGNGLHHHRRAEARRWRAYERSIPALPSSFDVDERIDAEVVGPKLAHGLRTLTARDRDALLLAVWADLSYAEIAETLAVPIGTVRSRIARARSRLRTALGDLAELHTENLSRSQPRGDDE